MTLRDTYERLRQTREEFLQRGHRSSVLTIPSVLPKDGMQRHRLPQNFQSVGARGVNNLSAKLGLTLFPQTLPIMRLSVSPSKMQELTEAAGGDAAAVQAEIEASLALIEKEVTAEFSQDGWRPALSEGLRHAVVTGNSLIYDRPGGLRPAHFDIRRYVVERDAEGTMLRCVLRQLLTKTSLEADLAGRQLSQEALESLMTHASSGDMGSTVDSGEPHFELHTGCELTPSGDYAFWQEVGSVQVPGSYQLVAAENLPLIPIRFQPVYGAAYGRGYVEDYDGDLLSLESISRSLVEGAMSLAKILWLVKPGGTTKPSTLRSPNGSIRSGDGDDVSTVQAEKGSDLGVAFQIRNELVVQLSKAFLLNGSVQRAGERVTAEEIRYVAQELEDALGGVYSSMADTVQAPIVLYIFNKLKRQGKIGKLPSGVIPIVATGLEAISRNHEVTRLREYLGMVTSVIPPEEVSTVLRLETIAADAATSHNLDKSRLVRSEDEIAALRQERQEQSLVSDLGGPVLQAASSAQQQPS